MAIATKSNNILGGFCVLILAVAMVLSGCTEASEDPTFSPGNNQQNEANDGNDANDGNEGNEGNDANDGSEGAVCENVDCPDGEVCVEGDCFQSTEAGNSCATPKVIELEADSVQTFWADPSGDLPVHNTNCSQDGDESPQAVFAFSVDEPMRINAHISESEHSLVQELRTESCIDAEAADYCSANPENFFVEADTDYFLIVEAAQSWMVGEFALEIETQSLVCSPPGSWSCDGDDVVQCYAGAEERTFECPQGCNDGDCLGDSCANPLEVTESTTITVDLNSFRNNISFADSPSCSTNRQSGPTTNGEELVFFLPGLMDGQVLDIGAPSSAYAIGVLEECSSQEPQCVAADDTTGSLIWEVETAGDYYVVVNRFTTSGQDDAEFRIDILE